jgi:glycosyltransferase involved in cell wall biosynthesis
MARAYAAESDRITYLEHEGHANRLQSASRNLGVAHAAGEWIAFLDQDDVWLPEKLEAQLALTRTFPRAEFVYGPVLRWRSWKPQDSGTEQVVDIGFDESKLVEPPGLAAEWLTRQNTPCPSSVIVRRTTFERLGGFDESLGNVYEDQTFALKVALHATILATPNVWTRWREHEESHTAVTLRAGMFSEARDNFERWALAYIDHSGVENSSDLVAALRRGRYAARLYARGHEGQRDPPAPSTSIS